MPLNLWWTFAVATFFVSAIPGPNMLHMMSSGMRHGLKMTFFTMAGCMTAVLSITAASAVGVDTLLALSSHLFDVLRFCGAGYLIYLGAKTALLPVAAPLDPQVTAEIPATATPREHYRSGFMVGVTNPKLLLFATAFFPQFMSKDLPQLPQLLLLLGTFFCIESGWYLAYATGGAQIAKYINAPGRQRAFNRFVGALFMAFGLLLIVHRPL